MLYSDDAGGDARDRYAIVIDIYKRYRCGIHKVKVARRVCAAASQGYGHFTSCGEWWGGGGGKRREVRFWKGESKSPRQHRIAAALSDARLAHTYIWRARERSLSSANLSRGGRARSSRSLSLALRSPHSKRARLSKPAVRRHPLSRPSFYADTDLHPPQRHCRRRRRRRSRLYIRIYITAKVWKFGRKVIPRAENVRPFSHSCIIYLRECIYHWEKNY